MSIERVSIPFGAQPLEIETGRIAKQADASIIASVGGTTLMVNVTWGAPREGCDFFPLMVDYREKFYASGRIPGGFFKRESRPGDLETLRARITDRAIRPLFPEGLRNDVMVYITVLSSDNENPAEIMALTAASIALRNSSLPFPTATAAVRVGRIDGEFILNPTFEQIKESDLDLIIAGTAKAINMVESGAKELSETEMIDALKFAHDAIKDIIVEAEKFTGQTGKEKFSFEAPKLPEKLSKAVAKKVQPFYEKLCASKLDKKGFNDGEHQGVEETTAWFVEKYADEVAEHPEYVGLAKELCIEVLSGEVRKLVVQKKQRVDGRSLTEVRPLAAEVDILAKTHGSALFTRGSTQALGVVTLGTLKESQMIDTMLGTWDKYFMLHYNFPPYSVGEARPMRAPGRREIGHGALAERALEPMIPATEDFPYTVRVVSEITESNGSSSMASVCVGALSLMAAGVPLKRPVAGIAMGLIEDESGAMEVLTDIQGVEDHLGDMDFKVAGTREGITALQMDIKIEGVTFEIMERALMQAKDARFHILETMEGAIAEPRTELNDNAPRVQKHQINPEKIGALIGPGGKIIRGIQERHEVKIDVAEDGVVLIFSAKGENALAALEEVKLLTDEILPGQIFEGKVVRTADFGAIVELGPGVDGMCHISELALGRVPTTESVCNVGDILKVKVLSVEGDRLRLSHKAILIDEGGVPEDDGGSYGGGRGRDDRGGRGGGRGGDRGGRGGGRGGDRGGRGGGDRGGRGGRESSGGGEDREFGFRERPRSKKPDSE